ncbi:hypothetical protein CTEN210_09116 [Chaetoceros tenuissimus]|uniref:Uncharacterized protein n=1 Tax=Chaetoceros tenuissimus TaxID=426638 RepID=A0AAD3H6X1_9STRA|nr:hypothetical protein CTEN210_09116 [Chaetoceros tenuissimus]
MQFLYFLVLISYLALFVDAFSASHDSRITRGTREQEQSRGRRITSNVSSLIISKASHILSQQSSTSLNCICINCAKVTNCKAYHFVESKHSQPHMNDEPSFTPQDGSPTIHVNIRTTRSEEEMARIWAEHIEQTKRAEEKDSRNQEGKLMGENTYDLSVKTTYEYDVVACDDYEEDMGIWVRNMPEEIRKANPDFVPT